MNKYCYRCQSVYSAILGRCPKCSRFRYTNPCDYNYFPRKERIYNDKVSTKSMDTLKRIENAEEELRLAKLELTNDPNRVCLNEVRGMLRDMSLSDSQYIIKESSPSHVKVIVDDYYYFIGKHVLSNWDASCIVYDGKLNVIFRRK